ncbi:hypothetical protein ColTof4_14041 [Colletotrichum tofieldiae]|nr:hypothetical protein ColTof3_14676 [Colletotrichum tofieldiae]GKT81618.1 hypothetical protein ColTof4_14041 [Colletotrichum tofieldiae]
MADALRQWATPTADSAFEAARTALPARSHCLVSDRRHVPGPNDHHHHLNQHNRHQPPYPFRNDSAPLGILPLIRGPDTVPSSADTTAVSDRNTSSLRKLGGSGPSRQSTGPQWAEVPISLIKACALMQALAWGQSSPALSIRCHTEVMAALFGLGAAPRTIAAEV